MKKSIVGELIGRRNIVYAPVNKAGVLLIFARLLDEFDMLVEETADDCSYVIVRRRVDEGWERIQVNLEFRSSDYNPGDNDNDNLLICWNHDWPECPLKVFELKNLFFEEKPPQTQVREPEPEQSNEVSEEPAITLSDIIPENPNEILIGKDVTAKRFEKAIGDLDAKIKNFFPEST